MGAPLYSSCIQKILRLLLSVLLLWSSMQVHHSVEGTSLSKPMKIEKDGEEKMMMKALMGSRPPRCEMRCTTCGHCEAVQVPVVPVDKIETRKFFRSTTSRVDYSSNYKPVNWKCKCGNMMFNP